MMKREELQVVSRMKACIIFCILFLITSGGMSDLAGQGRYELSAKKDYPILAAGTGLSIAGWYLLKNTVPLDRDQIDGLSCEWINPLDRWACRNWSPEISRWSDIGLIASVLLPLTLSLSSQARDEIADLGLLYFENVMLTSAVVSISKGLFQRIRPMAYNKDIPSELKDQNTDLRHSFYSGHTAGAFSGVIFFATVFDRYHPDSKWQPFIWSGSLALASSVALFRVLAGKHFPTDVIVGAIVGGFTGYLVPEIHEKASTENNNPQPIVFNVVFAL
ncbi:phosphatase PAP2 family protein [candidate division KSB1 bacterium]|nr:phosphatase PAP2 family protein [candidate division KSB1 bacterium]